MGLEQHLRTRFIRPAGLTNWLVRLGDQALRGNPVEAVRDMIKGDPLRGVALRDLPSPKAAEMRMQNVSTLSLDQRDAGVGDELEESMTLAQVVTRLTLGTWDATKGRMRRIRCS